MSNLLKQLEGSTSLRDAFSSSSKPILGVQDAERPDVQASGMPDSQADVATAEQADESAEAQQSRQHEGDADGQQSRQHEGEADGQWASQHEGETGARRGGRTAGGTGGRAAGHKPGRKDGRTDGVTDRSDTVAHNRMSNRIADKGNAVIPGLMREREQVSRLSTYINTSLFDRLAEAMTIYGQGAQRKIVEYGLEKALEEMGL